MRGSWVLALLLAGCGNDGTGKADDHDGDGLTETDCDDSDAGVGEASVWFADADGDGHGSSTAALSACEQPDGYVTTHDDCDDTAGARFPGNTEVCDGVDNDCNDLVDIDDPGLAVSSALTLYADLDGDGYGDDDLATSGCELSATTSLEGGDCDDQDPAVHPAAAEVCNGFDDDCDGLVDDDDDGAEGTAWYLDDDGDGYGDDGTRTTSCTPPEGAVSSSGDCDDADAARHPGAEEADCADRTDYNCDGSTGYDDADHDGTPACEDCNDAEASAWPGADETCNGVDDDCDGATDEADAIDGTVWYADSDADGYGDVSVTTTGCTAPAGTVADNSDCDDTSATVHPGASETCNGDDDDCDGVVDNPEAVTPVLWYADADGDGHGDATSFTEACTAPAGHVTDSTDCDDTDPLFNPAATELCNGVDDDCDGTTDEADAADVLTWYADRDGDGYGDSASATTACEAPADSVADSTDCDDADTDINPGAAELCNGLDDDCDGNTDEADALDALVWYVDADADGYGDASSPTPGCSAPLGALADSTDCDDTEAAVNPGASELCNTVDDDCDGDTDEADALDATAWYFDADGDTYGDPTRLELACDPPSRAVADDQDCDDTDPTVSPVGSEVCNGADDDCNGTADDNASDMLEWYEDADSDGYGDESGAPVDACDAPAGYVEDLTDCDDADVDVNPGESESCDTLDNDCDGSRDETGCTCAIEEYSGTLYLFCTTAATWTAARTNCLSWGYDLVAIGSSAENIGVVDEAVSRSTSMWWIGYNDSTVEGTFAWSNGEAAVYSNWASGEPNDTGKKEDCAQLYRFTDYTWNDAACSSSLRYICEE